MHQDNNSSSVLKCPNFDKQSNPTLYPEVKVDKVDEDCESCDAMFSSPRLRCLHLSTSKVNHPKFACPLRLNISHASGSDFEKLSILASETAADMEGLMILAYCCPICSRFFAGHDALSR